MSNQRVWCGVFGVPGERRYACVGPPRMQQAVETGDGVPLERYDSEEECEAGCTALARLPPEMAAEVSGYLPLGALAAVGRAGRGAGYVAAGAELASEREACAAVAERFPEAWRRLSAGGAPGGAFRVDPQLLAQRCAAWRLSCMRPCADILARMSDTYTASLGAEDMTDRNDEEDPAGDRWWITEYRARSLADARFRNAADNAPFHERTAPARTVFGVGAALPVFFPGNTVRVLAPDAATGATRVERWGYVGGAIRDLWPDDDGLLRFFMDVVPAREPWRILVLPEEEDIDQVESESIELEFTLPPPPGMAPPGRLSGGIAVLLPAQRYLEYVRRTLGIRFADLMATYGTQSGVPQVLYEHTRGALRAASERFAALGFPAARMEVRVIEPWA